MGDKQQLPEDTNEVPTSTPAPQHENRTTWRYAQIDLSTGRCIGISYLGGEVLGDHMILLDNADDVQLNDVLSDGVWTRPDPPPPPEPQPTVLDRVNSLETESVSTMLAVAEVYETASTESATALLGLTEAYEIILQQRAMIDDLNSRVKVLESAQKGGVN